MRASIPQRRDCGRRDVDEDRLLLQPRRRRMGGRRRHHYPGTYAHGVYNRETTVRAGRLVPNEDLLNLPNWLVLMLRIEGEDPIRFGDVELLNYRHELDFRNALISRTLRFRDRAGGRRRAQPAVRQHGPYAPDAPVA